MLKVLTSCGDTNFNKRAVFWYAAQEALKAGRVDSSMKSSAQQAANSYNANAPSKSEIFQEGNAGTTIKLLVVGLEEALKFQTCK